MSTVVGEGELDKNSLVWYFAQRKLVLKVARALDRARIKSFDELVKTPRKFISPGRTIGEGELALLCNLTWINARIHTDREYAKHTQFGERILPGPCVLACVIGLAGASGLINALDRDGLRIVALLGFEDVRFTAPVKPGDTITVHSEILGVRPTTKNPKRAVVQIRDVAFNQDGHEVMSDTRSGLIELTT